MTFARKKYVIPLGRISAALKNPNNTDISGTFKVVLLLAAFGVTLSWYLEELMKLTVRRLLAVSQQLHGVYTLVAGQQC
jgi:hypothetical protein